MVCISNCDKITPGMLMAAMRLNVPAIFVSGGPMEAGKISPDIIDHDLDLVDAMVVAADDSYTDEQVLADRTGGLPDLRVMLGHVHGEFDELPGRGAGPRAARQWLDARHPCRPEGAVPRGGPQDRRESPAAHYELDDKGLLPRDIATFDAFENAMSLDIAMGGSTNTVLHLLAIAHEGGVKFTMEDIDRLSRKVPVLCKVAPAKQDVHMEDVHRAGGIMGILGEMSRAGLLHTNARTVHSETMDEAIQKWDVVTANDGKVDEFYRAAPGGVRTTQAFSTKNRYKELDRDRKAGVIRSADHAFSKDGGLAVLYGNLAEEGCIVKTAGVDESILKFSGPAHIFESQDNAVLAILNGKVKPGEVVLIRYEGPRGGPGMQEMLYPTSYLKSKGLGKVCALVTDGRFSGGSSGLSIGHVSPEAAEGGAIGLVEQGDTIEIDIPNRRIHLAVDEAVLAERRKVREAKGWQPEKPRKRKISAALRAYAALTTSASKGAVRNI